MLSTGTLGAGTYHPLAGPPLGIEPVTSGTTQGLAQGFGLGPFVLMLAAEGADSAYQVA